MKKSIAVFGSTGSIGKSALEVLAQHPDTYQIISLVAGGDVKTLIKQARIFKPKYVAISNQNLYGQLKEGLQDLKQIKILAGDEEINQLAAIKCDLFLSAIVGIAALIPTLNAIKAGSNIGCANKECLVAAGDLMLKESRKSGSKLLPIDSEHNAIFQIFEQQNLDKISNITLTASGGPFLYHSAAQMKNITKEQAIKHPNWKMGAKISVDSATMMNKGLEMIEAFRLFPVKKEQIEVIIHPQSIMHGLVDYADGSSLAMLSQPDMKVPLAFAFSYPKRIKINHKKLDLAKIGKLDFFPVDNSKFPAVNLAKQALKTGGNAPCIFNAANEIAVERFLKGEIAFNRIVEIVMEVLNSISYSNNSLLEDIIDFNNQAKNLAKTK
jgi:1-deoxy-D-xylulose-5-phosphate reductoisomerase